MTSKHTPGPWVYDMRDDGSMEVHNVDYSMFIAKRHKMNDRDEAVANARLIAAAPDLLAALEFVAKLMHADVTPKGKADYSVVRDAIAAARGEA